MNVLITGSSSGFGRLIVETLAGKGHTVYASMRGVAGKNAKAAGELGALGKSGKVHVVELDVTSQESVDTAVKEILAKGGKIDAVVNNAGIGAMGFAEAFDAAQMAKVFDVNVFGVQRVNRAVLPAMRAQGSGLLIHITSGLGRFIMPLMGIYGATKFALEALAESYRYELSLLGIDSVIVQPGAFNTDFAKNLVPPSDPALGGNYGAASAVQEQMGKAFAGMFNGPDLPSPQLVADAVLKLVETPSGARPIRTVVDPLTGQGTTAINGVCEQVQAGSLEAMGMKNLLHIGVK